MTQSDDSAPEQTYVQPERVSVGLDPTVAMAMMSALASGARISFQEDWPSCPVQAWRCGAGYMEDLADKTKHVHHCGVGQDDPHPDGHVCSCGVGWAEVGTS